VIARHQGTVGAKRAERPPPPELPGEVDYLWSAYCALDASRQCGMAANPIQYVEMLAYGALFELRWERWEIELIKLLDREYLLQLARNESSK
jgi:hypothetical protein